MLGVQVRADGAVVVVGTETVELVTDHRLREILTAAVGVGPVQVWVHPGVDRAVWEHIAAVIGAVDGLRCGARVGELPGAQELGPALAAAAGSDDVTLVRALLERGAQVNERDEWGRTALHHAAMSRSSGCARFLIAAGAEVDATDTVGSTPCQLAAAAGAYEVVCALADAGADTAAGGLGPAAVSAGAGRLLAYRVLVRDRAPRWAPGSWVRLVDGRQVVVVDGRRVGVGGRWRGCVIELGDVRSAAIDPGRAGVVISCDGQEVAVTGAVRTVGGLDGAPLLVAGLAALERRVCDAALVWVLAALDGDGDGGAGEAARRFRYVLA